MRKFHICFPMYSSLDLFQACKLIDKQLTFTVGHTFSPGLDLASVGPIAIGKPIKVPQKNS